MIKWLEIQDAPTRYYIENPDALPYLSAAAAAHQLLVSIEPLRAGVDGENGNLSVTLRPGAMRYMQIPPLAATAIVWRVEKGQAIAEFTGTVQKVTATPAALTVALAQ